MIRKIFDGEGRELDLFLEISKYAGYLRKSSIARHLAIYDLYKQTMHLPGSVAEFGVYNGSTFLFLARLIEIFNASQHETAGSSSRHLYGFESFAGFSELSPEDLPQSPAPSTKRVGGLQGDRKAFFEQFDFLRQSSAIADRFHIVEGDVCKTLPEFAKNHSGVRLSLVLLDVDLYEPSKVILDHIYDIVVPGGIIVFDEYGIPEWPGETQAVDEFLAKHPMSLQAIPWSYSPGAYCIKS
ncbi:MAG TPA: TylF/MycF/NovP-related O-methyltransferase [Kiritimatiellia bacterium]|nr:TylF/MycF/NovP-related O-methyltransferase [Kiritimatiellia bacterium]